GLVTSTLANVLIVQNAAPRGAGVYGSALRMVNATLAQNSGPALDTGSSKVRPAITMQNTLVSSFGGAAGCAGDGAPSSFQNAGNNLQFPNATCPGVTV